MACRRTLNGFTQSTIYRVFICFFIGIGGSLPTQTMAETLHMAVASNFKQTHQALVDLFLQKRAVGKDAFDIKIVTSSGSTGMLFAQIKNGAPYDVLLSADATRPDRLIELGLADPQSRTIYVQGQVVLWQPRAKQQVSIESLAQGKKRYVLANPDLAPYGAAARELMGAHGLWKQRDVSRITAQNIATAFQYLASGSVDIGWVAMSQLKAWQHQHPINQESYWLPDVADYPEIHQVAVTLNRSTNKAQAKAFLSFLSAPEAKSLIRSYGYLLPDKVENVSSQ